MEKLACVRQMLVIVVDRRARQDAFVQSGGQGDNDAGDVIARVTLDPHQGCICR